MRRFLPTIILVVVCVAGFWYASSNNFFREKQEEAIPLIAFKVEDVQSFSALRNVESGDESVPLIELHKEDKGWVMTAPETYPLNSYSADFWVNAISNVTSNKIVEEEVSDLAKYGLDNPREQFAVTLKDGSSKTLQIGIANPVSGYYAKTADTSTVYQINEEQITPLRKNPFDFIDKTPFQFEYNKLKSLSVELLGEQWTLTKTELDKMAYESRWKLGELELTADEGTSFLDRLVNTSTNHMLKPISEVNLNEPQMKVVIVVDKDGKDETLTYLGEATDEDTVWFALQGGQWAYALTFEQAERLYSKAEEVFMSIVERMQREQAAEPEKPEQVEQ